MSDFADRLQQAAEDSLLNEIRKGTWIQPNYQSRVPLDMSMLRGIYDALDMEAIQARVVHKLEDYVADKILNSMTTEITTDIKQILSNKELREDVRSIIREKIREHVTALQP